MPADGMSSGMYDSFAYWSSQTGTSDSDDQSTLGQQSSYESQSTSTNQFENSYNPYASALADVFGLD